MNLRDKIRASGWGEIQDRPEPIDLGTTANTTADEVIEHLKVKLECLRMAAQIFASGEEYQDAFEGYLAEAMKNAG